MTDKPRGRRRKFEEYEDLLALLSKGTAKRPKYIRGVGVFRGAKKDTAWLKLYLRHGGQYRGKSYAPGHSLEINLGSLSSWSWDQLEQKHRDLQGKADRGEPLETVTALSFREWAEEWLERHEARRGKNTTDALYVRKKLVPAFGDLNLDGIDVAAVNKWLTASLLELKSSSVKRAFNTLKAMLNEAITYDHLERNPCDGAMKIKGIEARQRFLSDEETVRLLAVADRIEPWMADLILWYLHSGMRKSEALGLLWSDIRTLPGGTPVVDLRRTKSDKGRMVPCTKTMADILERQQVRRKDGDRRVFPYTPITIRRRWDKIREAAGLDDIVMHDLRRTSATRAVTAGVDLRTLQARMGHSNLTMLEKHYASIVGSAQEDAATKIESAFGSDTSTVSNDWTK